MMPIRRTLAAVLCAAALSGVAGGAIAQDATPAAGVDALEALTNVEIPALANAFHAGTCSDYEADPAVQLAPAEYRGAAISAGGVITAQGTPEAMGSALGIPVSVGTTTVDLPIEAIVEGGHALVVHDPADETAALACGVVEGPVDRRGNLFIGIESQNDTGVSGIGWLNEADGKTTVTVMLTRPFFVNKAAPGFVAEPSVEDAIATPGFFPDGEADAPEFVPGEEVAATPVA
jgi:hypothetical protein